ncbi:hypothetical protein B0H34DRAFT_643944, partial [Crassisporium funariophilum]
RSSPPPYSQPQSSSSCATSKQTFFQSGADSKSPSVCALCLGQDPHNVFKCQSEVLWDGSKARCRRNDQGRLVSPTGCTLCSDWNTRRGCTMSGHEQCHECS